MLKPINQSFPRKELFSLEKSISIDEVDFIISWGNKRCDYVELLPFNKILSKCQP
jgi:hypothetical protein